VAKLIRRLLPAVIPLATGWVGLALSFSDRSPGESMLERSAWILLAQTLGGAVVGLALPKRWYLGALGAWGSLLWIAIRPQAIFERQPVQFPEDLIHPAWVPHVAVLLAMVGAYVAARSRAGR
jgi:hypothetical protein